ncbi:heavy-metal-associated domain-containing protein [Caldimonas brevitalea]|uniref:Heavy metal transporter n=1 Tax=Caldimonas brevitalea TaxID=413882 RepID=A0A0G3BMS0_9BURK|nr:heavy-metal-associated domain-containing protein [Caldimonas brevitalea]AKJ30717.1 heavy metal transporter [Caldimonas brevitalea]
MISFEVNDMTCGHCVSAITKAVKQTDRGAVVAVDLGSKRVQIDSKVADEAELKAAIEEAGYTPVKAAAAAEASGQSGGSCCGSCH